MSLRHLPDARLSSCLKVRCQVDTGSLIHIHRNVYSVHSRLIGEAVEARLFADRIEVWYADKLVDTLPRLVGRDRHAVNYRHVIDSLIRKPGAFANYAYRDDLFPTTRFRLAYDRFCEGRDERSGAKDYLKILHHAAHDGEAAIDDALRILLASDTALSPDAVIALAKSGAELPAATAVVVEPPDLRAFDTLLTLTEEIHGEEEGDLGEPAADGGTVDGAVAGTPPAGVPGSLPEPGPAGGAGEPELSAVPGSVDHARMRGPHAGTDPASGGGGAAARRQILGLLLVVALAAGDAAAIPDAPRRAFLARRENVLVFGKAGSGKTHALCAVAEQLVLRGHPVLFATCSLLVQELVLRPSDWAQNVAWRVGASLTNNTLGKPKTAYQHCRSGFRLGGRCLHRQSVRRSISHYGGFVFARVLSPASNSSGVR
ncbi:MAG: ATP-binding protein [Gemmataceae bacterium]